MGGTIEHLDPHSLVVGDNVREYPNLNKPFLDSIAEHGVSYLVCLRYNLTPAYRRSSHGVYGPPSRRRATNVPLVMPRVNRSHLRQTLVLRNPRPAAAPSRDPVPLSGSPGQRRTPPAEHPCSVGT